MATLPMKKSTVHTVNEAAERFDRTTARIRQICIEHDIGETIENRIRILTEADMRKIGQIIEENGHSRNSEES